MSEELGERTERASGRKLSKARQNGQVAKSPEFAAAVDMIGALILLLALGPSLISTMKMLVQSGLGSDRLNAGGVTEITAQILAIAAETAWVLLPFLLLMFLVAAGAQFVQVGWLWTWKPVMPKFAALNPLKGVKKLLNKRTVIKTVVSIVKLSVVLFIAGAIIAANLRPIAFLPALSVMGSLAQIGEIIYDLVLWLLSLLLIVGLCDFFYQRWQRMQDLKMTKQEVKEERKSMEGDEQTKARRLRMARQMILQQTRQSVNTADVIVTNPTHFAVAIKYDPDNMHAPRVVAKGADFMAFRIREMATQAGVPIVEKPVLARALYAGVDVGRYVSPEFYQAIAEILAYVYRLKHKVA